MTIIAGVVLMLIPVLTQAAPESVKAAKPVDQAAKNKREGDAFLAANKMKPGVVTLDSGVQYRILKAGNGTKPTRDDGVICHYRATTIAGTEFSSSLGSKRPAVLPVKKVTRGLEGLSTVLDVKAAYVGEVLQVDITQRQSAVR